MHRYKIETLEDGWIRLTVWTMDWLDLVCAVEFGDVEDAKDYVRDEWPTAKSEQTLNEERA